MAKIGGYTISTGGARQFFNDVIAPSAMPITGGTAGLNAVTGGSKPLQVNNGFVYESAGAAVDPKKVKDKEKKVKDNLPKVTTPKVETPKVEIPKINTPFGTFKSPTGGNIGTGGGAANIGGGGGLFDPNKWQPPEWLRQRINLGFDSSTLDNLGKNVDIWSAIFAKGGLFGGTGNSKGIDDNLNTIFSNIYNWGGHSVNPNGKTPTVGPSPDQLPTNSQGMPSPFGNPSTLPGAPNDPARQIPNNGVVGGPGTQYTTGFPGKFTQYKKASWEGMMPEEQDPSGAICKRYRLLQQNLAANESRLGQGEQEALNRRFASMGAQNSGAALRNSQLQSDISGRRLLEQQNALGASESAEKQAAKEAANQRALAAAQMKIGSEDTRRGQNQQMQQMELGNYQFEQQYKLAAEELALNKVVMEHNMEIADKMLEINDQGVIEQIVKGILPDLTKKPVTEWFK